MLRFSLFGFPVTIQWMFWIVAALLGGVFSATTPEAFQRVLLWVASVFVSILAHELGHAYYQRKYGGRPQIVLHGFGGFAQSEGMFGRKQSLTITGAGPAVSLFLGLVFWLIVRSVQVGIPDAEGVVHWFFPRDMNRVLIYWLQIMVWINLFWGALNLVPVLPLDGGRLLEHFMGGRNLPLRAKIGFVAALGVVVLALAMRQFFMAILFGYLAYVNLQISQRKPVVDIFTNSRY